jgi:hypothetical protein
VVSYSRWITDWGQSEQGELERKYVRWVKQQITLSSIEHGKNHMDFVLRWTWAFCGPGRKKAGYFGPKKSYSWPSHLVGPGLSGLSTHFTM